MAHNLKKILLELIGISFAVFALSLIVSRFVLKTDRTHEILLGFLTSFSIFISGFAATNWAFKRSMKAFMGVVLGGMFVRFLIIGAILLLLIQFTDIHIFAFVLSFFIFYIIYQFYEIRFINLRLSKGKKWLEVLREVS